MAESGVDVSPWGCKGSFGTVIGSLASAHRWLRHRVARLLHRWLRHGSRRGPRHRVRLRGQVSDQEIGEPDGPGLGVVRDHHRSSRPDRISRGDGRLAGERVHPSPFGGPVVHRHHRPSGRRLPRQTRAHPADGVPRGLDGRRTRQPEHSGEFLRGLGCGHGLPAGDVSRGRSRRYRPLAGRAKRRTRTQRGRHVTDQ